MNELISIRPATISGQRTQTIDARKLHAFLGSKQDYTTWIKNRIEKYGFTQGVDFVKFHKTVEKGFKPQTEYSLTIEMAKEISMVERNDKGKEARQYFIACEKIAQKPIDPMTVLNDPVAMRGLLLTYRKSYYPGR